jgi:hypothetical protein
MSSLCVVRSEANDLARPEPVARGEILTPSAPAAS